ncbi:MAG: peptidyl-prolyl cis-trans isomerase, partial [Candidatus Sulfotelmatobacter sp.]
MRLQCLVYLLLASLACGQAAQPATPSTADNASEVKVGPDDPVITVNDFCADAAQHGDACKTVITRAQFEKLTEALQPGMSLALRLRVANAYARNLRMSAAAEKRGLDKTPAFEEEMRFARMQLLAQDLTRALQADANNISAAEIEDYYKKNESAYEQATVARIFVPRAKQIVPANGEQEDAQTKAAEVAMTKLAANLRARAANGEDPDKLQIEAYADAGIDRTNVSTKMEKVRRDVLPPRHEAVMDLKPGEVSEVFSDPEGAHFIYKMIGKRILTLEEVEMEIRAAISSQRYRDSMKSFQGDVVFSDAYFNPPRKLMPPALDRGEKKNTPPAE